MKDPEPNALVVTRGSRYRFGVHTSAGIRDTVKLVLTKPNNTSTTCRTFYGAVRHSWPSCSGTFSSLSPKGNWRARVLINGVEARAHSFILQ